MDQQAPTGTAGPSTEAATLPLDNRLAGPTNETPLVLVEPPMATAMLAIGGRVRVPMLRFLDNHGLRTDLLLSEEMALNIAVGLLGIVQTINPALVAARGIKAVAAPADLPSGLFETAEEFLR